MLISDLAGHDPK